MISAKPTAARTELSVPPMTPESADRTSPRAAATERGLSATRSAHPERDAGRTILYERLTGDAARERARQPEPRGAGLPAEIVDRIEYIEVWSTPNEPAGFDYRGYSFGGALIASRSTRS